MRARVEAAAALFPRRRAIDVPLPEISGAAFMREVADVHRELFAQYAELYGDDLQLKIERCLEVSDADYAEAAAQRDEYRKRFDDALDGVDLLLTPTLGLVAPPTGRTADNELRLRILERTFPLNLVGWPALALPCGAAEDGLPASVQLAGRPGEDALVLAAGVALEAALS